MQKNDVQECAIECRHVPTCFAFTFDEQTMECTLSYQSHAFESEAVNSNSLEWYDLSDC